MQRQRSTEFVYRPVVPRRPRRQPILQRLGGFSAMGEFLEADFADPDRRQTEKRELRVFRRDHLIVIGIENDLGHVVEPVACLQLSELPGVVATLVEIMQGRHPLVQDLPRRRRHEQR
jgi:hypothetical protein